MEMPWRDQCTWLQTEVAAILLHRSTGCRRYAHRSNRTGGRGNRAAVQVNLLVHLVEHFQGLSALGACVANASLSSKKSISAMVRTCALQAFLVAGTGP